MTDRNALDPTVEIPEDALEDREAQDHELADVETGGRPQPGLYPADDLPDREGDVTPDIPRPEVDWDERVQPERPDEQNAETDDIEQGA